LLDIFQAQALGFGAAVVRIDAREVVPTPEGVIEAIGVLPPVEGELDGAQARLVVLVDAFERLTTLERLFREEVLPQLPASTLTVVASRLKPAAEWRADPAWQDLLRIVSLRNLSPVESEDYLVRSGVDADRHDELITASHGHPLALTLLSDLVVRGANVTGGDAGLLTPDLVTVLVQRFVDAVPSDRHRRALEVCALARVTTEDLLRDALGLDDARLLFDWLRDQSFIDSASAGLSPHDLTRDVVDVELRWRDPTAYKDVFRRVRAHIHHRLHTLDGVELQRAIYDEKFVFRNLPSVLSPVEWNTWGDVHPAVARPDDGADVLALVDRFEGPAAAQIAAHWWDRQPEAFHVVRAGDGRVQGFLALVTLSDLAPDDMGFDPGARAAVAFAQRSGPPRRGEVVTQTRFVIDRDRYQAPSPTLNATPILTLQRYLTIPNLSWDFLTLFEPEPFDDYFAIADLPRAEGADFEVDGRRYGLFAHDFRRVPVDTWLEVVTERALAIDPTAPTARERELIVLSHDEFVTATRRALRDLHRRDQLEQNPLVRSRVVMDLARPDTGRSAVLAGLVRSAIDTLQSDPRDEKRWRALDRTYVRPAASQEQAAELLGVPFSTYRRHLTEGVDQVVSWLWDRELYGGPPDA
jgi:hypothetical protein